MLISAFARRFERSRARYHAIAVRRSVSHSHANQQLRPILKRPLAEEKLMQRSLDDRRELTVFVVEKFAANLDLAVLIHGLNQRSHDRVPAAQLAGHDFPGHDPLALRIEQPEAMLGQQLVQLGVDGGQIRVGRLASGRGDDTEDGDLPCQSSSAAFVSTSARET